MAEVPHVDQIRPQMDFVAALNLGADVVRVIDREADSVGHWRDGTRAGHRALVRADDRLVRHGGRERTLVDLADELNVQGGLRSAGTALYRGRRVWRFVGQARVVLHRPANKVLRVALSGRQTKARRPITTTPRLAGVWVLQQPATWLSRDGPDRPKALLERHLPLFTGPSTKDR